MGLVIIGFFGFLFLFLGWAWRQSKVNDQKAKEFDRRFFEILPVHRRALIKNFHRLRRKDDYGNVDTSRWEQELEYFTREVLLKDPELKRAYDVLATYGGLKLVQLVELVDTYVQGALLEDETGYSEERLLTMDPIEFEHFCAEILRGEGWDARATQATGDQGVDVIAEKNGTKLVLQCKKYSSPVGNKAVQEIAAGKLHERADAGAVVTNASYTPSAKQLAGTTNIHLLHISELAGFAKTFV